MSDSDEIIVEPDVSTREIEIGENFYVAWQVQPGQYQAGVVVEKRKLKKSSQTDEATLKPNDFEYYIHFPNYDRRLDEWVTIDRIDLTTAVSADIEDQNTKHKRTHKRKYNNENEAAHPESNKKEDKVNMLATLEKEHEEITKVKNIQAIVLGKYEIETWYFSPYPEDYCGEETLYICEFCLKYMKKRQTMRFHCEKCKQSSPPGTEIYNHDGLSMYEVDGRDHSLYCQNLCLLSKLFLDHKTLYYDVDPFLFYVLCEVDSVGKHIVGYFSKEKHSQENYNLACILTFPPYQRKGYGKFLISISYELTKRENTTGSPEKPLSDLGKISYRSYWAHVILSYLEQTQIITRQNITVTDICKNTGIRSEDILSTLHTLNLLKYWKGQHVISISPQTVQAQLAQSRSIRLCDPTYLNWTPPEKTLPRKV